MRDEEGRLKKQHSQDTLKTSGAEGNTNTIPNKFK